MNRSDDFNRADNASTMGTPSDAGSDWTYPAGTWGIFSNIGYNAGADNPGVAALEASAADATVGATLTVFNMSAGLAFRIGDVNNFWFLRGHSGSGYQLWKRVAGSYTQIGSNVGTPANGDVLEVTCSGNSITAKVNSSTTHNTTDSALAANTQHGIMSFTDNMTRFEDFSITDLGGGGGGILYTQLERGTRGLLRGVYTGGV